MSLALSRYRGLGPPTPLVHRKNRFGTNGQRVSRALLIASAIYVVVMIACWILLPLMAVEDARVVELPPERFMVAQPPPQVALSSPPALVPDVAPQVAVRQVADLPEGVVNEPKPLPLRLRPSLPSIPMRARKAASAPSRRRRSSRAPRSHSTPHSAISPRRSGTAATGRPNPRAVVARARLAVAAARTNSAPSTPARPRAAPPISPAPP